MKNARRLAPVGGAACTTAVLAVVFFSIFMLHQWDGDGRLRGERATLDYFTLRPEGAQGSGFALKAAAFLRFTGIVSYQGSLSMGSGRFGSVSVGESAILCPDGFTSRFDMCVNVSLLAATARETCDAFRCSAPLGRCLENIFECGCDAAECDRRCGPGGCVHPSCTCACPGTHEHCILERGTGSTCSSCNSTSACLRGECVPCRCGSAGCQNGGTCVWNPLVDGCTCSCPGNWTGSSCTECAACLGVSSSDSFNPICSGHGKCTFGPGDLCAPICNCSERWGGEFCRRCEFPFANRDNNNTNECADCIICETSKCPAEISRCVPNRACTDYTCECTSSRFKGALCDECNGNWTGTNCTECPLCRQHGTNGVCVHDAECTSYELTSCFSHFADVQSDCSRCAPPWTGFPLCNESTACAAHQCSGHGICSLSEDGWTFSCACRDHWYGERCEKCPPQYRGVAGGEPTCDACNLCDGAAACDFAGNCTFNSNCTQHHCECDSRRVPGGNCDACIGNWTTAAPPLAKCDQCDLCLGDACGHGNCSATTECSNMECHCDPHWVFGPDHRCTECEAHYGAPRGGSYREECSVCMICRHGCSDHGECVASPDCSSFVCNCYERWSGTLCDQCNAPWVRTFDGRANATAGDTCSACDICFDNDCSGHGSCSESSHDCVHGGCTCDAHWEPFPRGIGEIAPCSQCPDQWRCNVTAIGGPMVPPPAPETCSCCNLCDDWRSPCSGHGNCTVVGNCTSIECDCDPRFSGDTCSDCSNSWNGPDCENCPLCTPSTCNGNGRCVPSEDCSRVTCVCDGHWTGDSCDVCPSEWNDHGCSPRCDVCKYACPDATSYCNGRAVATWDNETCSSPRCGDCDNYWTGDRCEICPNRYWGDDCDKCALCVGIDCGHGRCEVVGECQGIRCICDDFWTNDFDPATNKTSYCAACPDQYSAGGAGHPGKCDKCELCRDNCTNHGTCHVTISGGEDHCAGSYCDCTGHWEDLRDPDTGALLARCGSCPHPWTGPDCDTCGRCLVGDVCHGRGNCTVVGDCHSTRCDLDGRPGCDFPFKGDRCTECGICGGNGTDFPNPCHNGGVCTPTAGCSKFECSCPLNPERYVPGSACTKCKDYWSGPETGCQNCSLCSQCENGAVCTIVGDDPDACTSINCTCPGNAPPDHWSDRFCTGCSGEYSLETHCEHCPLCDDAEQRCNNHTCVLNPGGCVVGKCVCGGIPSHWKTPETCSECSGTWKTPQETCGQCSSACETFGCYNGATCIAEDVNGTCTNMHCLCPGTTATTDPPYANWNNPLHCESCKNNFTGPGCDDCPLCTGRCNGQRCTHEDLCSRYECHCQGGLAHWTDDQCSACRDRWETEESGCQTCPLCLASRGTDPCLNGGTCHVVADGCKDVYCTCPNDRYNITADPHCGVCNWPWGDPENECKRCARCDNSPSCNDGPGQPGTCHHDEACTEDWCTCQGFDPKGNASVNTGLWEGSDCSACKHGVGTIYTGCSSCVMCQLDNPCVSGACRENPELSLCHEPLCDCPNENFIGSHCASCKPNFGPDPHSLYNSSQDPCSDCDICGANKTTYVGCFKSTLSIGTRLSPPRQVSSVSECAALALEADVLLFSVSKTQQIECRHGGDPGDSVVVSSFKDGFSKSTGCAAVGPGQGFAGFLLGAFALYRIDNPCGGNPCVAHDDCSRFSCSCASDHYADKYCLSCSGNWGGRSCDSCQLCSRLGDPCSGQTCTMDASCTRIECHCAPGGHWVPDSNCSSCLVPYKNPSTGCLDCNLCNVGNPCGKGSCEEVPGSNCTEVRCTCPNDHFEPGCKTCRPPWRGDDCNTCDLCTKGQPSYQGCFNVSYTGSPAVEFVSVASIEECWSKAKDAGALSVIAYGSATESSLVCGFLADTVFSSAAIATATPTGECPYHSRTEHFTGLSPSVVVAYELRDLCNGKVCHVVPDGTCSNFVCDCNGAPGWVDFTGCYENRLLLGYSGLGYLGTLEECVQEAILHWQESVFFVASYFPEDPSKISCYFGTGGGGGPAARGNSSLVQVSASEGCAGKDPLGRRLPTAEGVVAGYLFTSICGTSTSERICTENINGEKTVVNHYGDPRCASCGGYWCGSGCMGCCACSGSLARGACRNSDCRNLSQCIDAPELQTPRVISSEALSSIPIATSSAYTCQLPLSSNAPYEIVTVRGSDQYYVLRQQTRVSIPAETGCVGLDVAALASFIAPQELDAVPAASAPSSFSCKLVAGFIYSAEQQEWLWWTDWSFRWKVPQCSTCTETAANPQRCGPHDYECQCGPGYWANDSCTHCAPNYVLPTCQECIAECPLDCGNGRCVRDKTVRNCEPFCKCNDGFQAPHCTECTAGGQCDHRPPCSPHGYCKRVASYQVEIDSVASTRVSYDERPSCERCRKCVRTLAQGDVAYFIKAGGPELPSGGDHHIQWTAGQICCARAPGTCYWFSDLASCEAQIATDCPYYFKNGESDSYDFLRTFVRIQDAREATPGRALQIASDHCGGSPSLGTGRCGSACTSSSDCTASATCGRCISNRCGNLLCIQFAAGSDSLYYINTGGEPLPWRQQQQQQHQYQYPQCVGSSDGRVCWTGSLEQCSAEIETMAAAGRLDPTRMHGFLTAYTPSDGERYCTTFPDKLFEAPPDSQITHQTAGAQCGGFMRLGNFKREIYQVASTPVYYWNGALNAPGHTAGSGHIIADHYLTSDGCNGVPVMFRDGENVFVESDASVLAAKQEGCPFDCSMLRRIVAVEGDETYYYLLNGEMHPLVYEPDTFGGCHGFTTLSELEALVGPLTTLTAAQFGEWQVGDPFECNMLSTILQKYGSTEVQFYDGDTLISFPDASYCSDCPFVVCGDAMFLPGAAQDARLQARLIQDQFECDDAQAYPWPHPPLSGMTCSDACRATEDCVQATLGGGGCQLFSRRSYQVVSTGPGFRSYHCGGAYAVYDYPWFSSGTTEPPSVAAFCPFADTGDTDAFLGQCVSDASCKGVYFGYASDPYRMNGYGLTVRSVELGEDFYYSGGHGVLYVKDPEPPPKGKDECRTTCQCQGNHTGTACEQCLNPNLQGPLCEECVTSGSPSYCGANTEFWCSGHQVPGSGCSWGGVDCDFPLCECAPGYSTVRVTGMSVECEGPVSEADYLAMSHCLSTPALSPRAGPVLISAAALSAIPIAAKPYSCDVLGPTFYGESSRRPRVITSSSGEKDVFVVLTGSAHQRKSRYRVPRFDLCPGFYLEATLETLSVPITSAEYGPVVGDFTCAMLPAFKVTVTPGGREYGIMGGMYFPDSGDGTCPRRHVESLGVITEAELLSAYVAPGSYDAAYVCDFADLVVVRDSHNAFALVEGSLLPVVGECPGFWSLSERSVRPSASVFQTYPVSATNNFSCAMLPPFFAKASDTGTLYYIDGGESYAVVPGGIDCAIGDPLVSASFTSEELVGAYPEAGDFSCSINRRIFVTTQGQALVWFTDWMLRWLVHDPCSLTAFPFLDHQSGVCFSTLEIMASGEFPRFSWCVIPGTPGSRDPTILKALDARDGVYCPSTALNAPPVTVDVGKGPLESSAAVGQGYVDRALATMGTPSDVYYQTTTKLGLKKGTASARRNLLAELALAYCDVAGGQSVRSLVVDVDCGSRVRGRAAVGDALTKHSAVFHRGDTQWDLGCADTGVACAACSGGCSEAEIKAKVPAWGDLVGCTYEPVQGQCLLTPSCTGSPAALSDCSGCLAECSASDKEACRNGGTCSYVVDSDTHRCKRQCTCPYPWTGPDCTEPTSRCDAKDLAYCGHASSCRYVLQGGKPVLKCPCDYGYTWEPGTQECTRCDNETVVVEQTTARTCTTVIGARYPPGPGAAQYTLGTLGATTAADCILLCQRDPNCAQVTYERSGTTRCDASSVASASGETNGAQLATTRCSSQPLRRACTSLGPNVRARYKGPLALFGGLPYGVLVTSADECQRLCQLDETCTAVVFDATTVGTAPFPCYATSDPDPVAETGASGWSSVVCREADDPLPTVSCGRTCKRYAATGVAPSTMPMSPSLVPHAVSEEGCIDACKRDPSCAAALFSRDRQAPSSFKFPPSLFSEAAGAPADLSEPTQILGTCTGFASISVKTDLLVEQEPWSVTVICENRGEGRFVKNPFDGVCSPRCLCYPPYSADALGRCSSCGSRCPSSPSSGAVLPSTDHLVLEPAESYNPVNEWSSLPAGESACRISTVSGGTPATSTRVYTQVGDLERSGIIVGSSNFGESLCNDPSSSGVQLCLDLCYRTAGCFGVATTPGEVPRLAWSQGTPDIRSGTPGSSLTLLVVQRGEPAEPGGGLASVMYSDKQLYPDGLLTATDPGHFDCGAGAPYFPGTCSVRVEASLASLNLPLFEDACLGASAPRETAPCPPGFPYLADHEGAELCYNDPAYAKAAEGPCGSWCALGVFTEEQAQDYLDGGCGIACPVYPQGRCAFLHVGAYGTNHDEVYVTWLTVGHAGAGAQVVPGTAAYGETRIRRFSVDFTPTGGNVLDLLLTRIEPAPSSLQWGWLFGGALARGQIRSLVPAYFSAATPINTVPNWTPPPPSSHPVYMFAVVGDLSCNALAGKWPYLHPSAELSSACWALPGRGLLLCSFLDNCNYVARLENDVTGPDGTSLKGYERLLGVNAQFSVQWTEKAPGGLGEPEFDSTVQLYSSYLVMQVPQVAPQGPRGRVSLVENDPVCEAVFSCPYPTSGPSCGSQVFGCEANDTAPCQYGSETAYQVTPWNRIGTCAVSRQINTAGKVIPSRTCECIAPFGAASASNTLSAGLEKEATTPNFCSGACTTPRYASPSCDPSSRACPGGTSPSLGCGPGLVCETVGACANDAIAIDSGNKKGFGCTQRCSCGEGEEGPDCNCQQGWFFDPARKRCVQGCALGGVCSKGRTCAYELVGTGCPHASTSSCGSGSQCPLEQGGEVCHAASNNEYYVCNSGSEGGCVSSSEHLCWLKLKGCPTPPSYSTDGKILLSAQCPQGGPCPTLGEFCEDPQTQSVQRCVRSACSPQRHDTGGCWGATERPSVVPVCRCSGGDGWYDGPANALLPPIFQRRTPLDPTKPDFLPCFLCKYEPVPGVPASAATMLQGSRFEWFPALYLSLPTAGGSTGASAYQRPLTGLNTWTSYDGACLPDCNNINGSVRIYRTYDAETRSCRRLGADESFCCNVHQYLWSFNNTVPVGPSNGCQRCCPEDTVANRETQTCVPWTSLSGMANFGEGYLLEAPWFGSFSSEHPNVNPLQGLALGWTFRGTVSVLGGGRGGGGGGGIHKPPVASGPCTRTVTGLQASFSAALEHSAGCEGSSVPQRWMAIAQSNQMETIGATTTVVAYADALDLSDTQYKDWTELPPPSIYYPNPEETTTMSGDSYGASTYCYLDSGAFVIGALPMCGSPGTTDPGGALFFRWALYEFTGYPFLSFPVSYSSLLASKQVVDFIKLGPPRALHYAGCVPRVSPDSSSFAQLRTSVDPNTVKGVAALLGEIKRLSGNFVQLELAGGIDTRVGAICPPEFPFPADDNQVCYTQESFAEAKTGPPLSWCVIPGTAISTDPVWIGEMIAGEGELCPMGGRYTRLRDAHKLATNQLPPCPQEFPFPSHDGTACYKDAGEALAGAGPPGSWCVFEGTDTAKLPGFEPFLRDDRDAFCSSRGGPSIAAGDIVPTVPCADPVPRSSAVPRAGTCSSAYWAISDLKSFVNSVNRFATTSAEMHGDVQITTGMCNREAVPIRSLRHNLPVSFTNPDDGLYYTTVYHSSRTLPALLGQRYQCSRSVDCSYVATADVIRQWDPQVPPGTTLYSPSMCYGGFCSLVGGTGRFSPVPMYNQLVPAAAVTPSLANTLPACGTPCMNRLDCEADGNGQRPNSDKTLDNYGCSTCAEHRCTKCMCPPLNPREPCRERCVQLGKGVGYAIATGAGGVIPGESVSSSSSSCFEVAWNRNQSDSFNVNPGEQCKRCVLDRGQMSYWIQVGGSFFSDVWQPGQVCCAVSKGNCYWFPAHTEEGIPRARAACEAQLRLPCPLNMKNTWPTFAYVDGTCENFSLFSTRGACDSALRDWQTSTVSGKGSALAKTARDSPVADFYGSNPRQSRIIQPMNFAWIRLDSTGKGVETCPGYPGATILPQCTDAPPKDTLVVDDKDTCTPLNLHAEAPWVRESQDPVVRDAYASEPVFGEVLNPGVTSTPLSARVLSEKACVPTEKSLSCAHGTASADGAACSPCNPDYSGIACAECSSASSGKACETCNEGSVRVVKDGACTYVNDCPLDGCGPGGRCVSGKCQCSSGHYLSSLGACRIACASNADCRAGGACDASTGVCSCTGGYALDEANGVCVPTCGINGICSGGGECTQLTPTDYACSCPPGRVARLGACLLDPCSGLLDAAGEVTEREAPLSPYTILLPDTTLSFTGFIWGPIDCGQGLLGTWYSKDFTDSDNLVTARVRLRMGCSGEYSLSAKGSALSALADNPTGHFTVTTAVGDGDCEDLPSYCNQSSVVPPSGVVPITSSGGTGQWFSAGDSLVVLISFQGDLDSRDMERLNDVQLSVIRTDGATCQPEPLEARCGSPCTTSDDCGASPCHTCAENKCTACLCPPLLPGEPCHERCIRVGQDAAQYAISLGDTGGGCYEGVNLEGSDGAPSTFDTQSQCLDTLEDLHFSVDRYRRSRSLLKFMTTDYNSVSGTAPCVSRAVATTAPRCMCSQTGRNCSLEQYCSGQGHSSGCTWGGCNKPVCTCNLGYKSSSDADAACLSEPHLGLTIRNPLVRDAQGTGSLYFLTLAGRRLVTPENSKCFGKDITEYYTAVDITADAISHIQVLPDFRCDALTILVGTSFYTRGVLHALAPSGWNPSEDVETVSIAPGDTSGVPVGGLATNDMWRGPIVSALGTYCAVYPGRRFVIAQERQNLGTVAPGDCIERCKEQAFCNIVVYRTDENPTTCYQGRVPTWTELPSEGLAWETAICGEHWWTDWRTIWYVNDTLCPHWDLFGDGFGSQPGTTRRFVIGDFELIPASNPLACDMLQPTSPCHQVEGCDLCDGTPSKTEIAQAVHEQTFGEFSIQDPATEILSGGFVSRRRFYARRYDITGIQYKCFATSCHGDPVPGSNAAYMLMGQPALVTPKQHPGARLSEIILSGLDRQGTWIETVTIGIAFCGAFDTADVFGKDIAVNSDPNGMVRIGMEDVAMGSTCSVIIIPKKVHGTGAIFFQLALKMIYSDIQPPCSIEGECDAPGASLMCGCKPGLQYSFGSCISSVG